MSLLDWEKKKHAQAMAQQGATFEAKAKKLRELAEEFSYQSRGPEPFCGIDPQTREELEAAIRAAAMPPFRVYVQPMQASNGLTYFVMLVRTDGPRPPTFSHEGRISVINRHDVAEANAEGYVWASFLGVPFTPCEAVQDTAAKNTVPEYGNRQAPDVLKLIERYKNACLKMALNPGDHRDGERAEALRLELEFTLEGLTLQPLPAPAEKS